VTDKASCDAAAAAAIEAFGRIDVLVTNAGITQPAKTCDITGADYDRILDVSLRGTLYMSQAVLPTMRAQKSGSIVCISSVNGSKGAFGQTNYSAAEAGVHGFTKALALEVAKKNVTVNVVAPGLIDTDMTKGLTDKDQTDWSAQIPAGRIGSPDDVAAAVCFLASDEASYITGQVLAVNGGMYT